MTGTLFERCPLIFDAPRGPSCLAGLLNAAMLTARGGPASSLGGCGCRNKMQGKLRAAHHPVLDLDGCTVQFGDALHDRQSKPRTALAVAVAPPEAAEDQLALPGRN